MFIDENEKRNADKQVGDFFEIKNQQGVVKIASWNCTSGFTTQFVHFEEFMKTRAEPYIDILCLQGIPMSNTRKNANVFELFEECGFTYVYDKHDGDLFRKTITLFKKSFLDKYQIEPMKGNMLKNYEIYHIKLKGIEGYTPCGGDDEFALINAYLGHDITNKFKDLHDANEYIYDNYEDAFKIMVGDLNFNYHDATWTQMCLGLWSNSPDIPTCNGFRADHIATGFDITTMVDERFTRGRYKGYIQIPRTHFHQPIYGWFVPSTFRDKLPYFTEDGEFVYPSDKNTLPKST